MRENPAPSAPGEPVGQSPREEILRLAAEFDNYRKQVTKELERSRERGADAAILQFLPVYEALERAVSDPQDPEQLRTGISAVLNLFREALTRLGCAPIPAVGEDFDPLYHEVVVAEPSPEPKHRILGELERGWMRDGRVLRPAKVRVSLGPRGGERA